MLNTDLLPEHILDDILQNMGVEDAEPGVEYDKAVAELRTLSPAEALDKWLNWNGIIGYTSQIIEALDELRKVETT